jgi:hypothetical protein
MAVVIELEDEHFRPLVIEVADPSATVAAFEKTINGRSR